MPRPINKTLIFIVPRHENGLHADFNTAFVPAIIARTLDTMHSAERYETISHYVDPNIVKMALLAHDAAERKSTSCEQERLSAARAAIAIFKGNS